MNSKLSNRYTRSSWQGSRSLFSYCTDF